MSLYLLGFLPSLFFGLRFFIQWIQSERKKESYVSALFWRLSIIGNVLLAVHYFLQLQYPLMLIQVVNGFISWRNLNYLQARSAPYSFKAACSLLAFLVISTSIAYGIQKTTFAPNAPWIDTPFGLTHGNLGPIPLYWHLIGIVGSFLFGSRFWLQWWQTEKSGRSELNPSFWILSIIGSLVA